MVPDFRDGANMQYTVNYDEELDYIFVKIQGELSLVTLQDIAMDVAKLVQKTNCHRILNDLRQATPVTGAVEIYNMPGTARQAGVCSGVGGRWSWEIKSGSFVFWRQFSSIRVISSRSSQILTGPKTGFARRMKVLDRTSAVIVTPLDAMGGAILK